MGMGVSGGRCREEVHRGLMSLRGCNAAHGTGGQGGCQLTLSAVAHTCSLTSELSAPKPARTRESIDVLRFAFTCFGLL
jgi:hypothetical protein